jgi:hypothetical protein
MDLIVPWWVFRQTLETMRPVRDPRKGGRPTHDVLRMFKVLVLRELCTLCTLSDEQVEYPIADRLSFQRFLGMDLTRMRPTTRRSGASGNGWGRSGCRRCSRSSTATST